MKIIIFLGNPGLKYRKTRHNIGFMVGDHYAKKHQAKYKNSIKFRAQIAETNGLKHDKALLVKPQKFYNLTGLVVKNLVKFYKANPSQDLLVVCDDLNLEFGALKSRQQGSDGGNNGLRSIIAQLGPKFARIRLGIDNAMHAKMSDQDFVLAKFSRTENQKLPELTAAAGSLIDQFLADELENQKVSL